MTDPAPVFDVVIAGAGVAGLALAAAVSQALGAGVSSPSSIPRRRRGRHSAEPPLRTVAIAEGPRRLLERIGAWEAIEPKAQPISRWRSWTGACATRCACRISVSSRRRRRRLLRMAFNDDVVASLSALCERLGVVRFAALGRRLAPRQACRRSLRSPDGADRSRPPRGRGRRRALEAARARRHSDLRLGLRPVRHRRDDRARARP